MHISAGHSLRGAADVGVSSSTSNVRPHTPTLHITTVTTVIETVAHAWQIKASYEHCIRSCNLASKTTCVCVGPF